MTPEEFKAARLRLGLTQAQLANILGVSKRSVSRYENGERSVSLTIANLMKLVEKSK